MATVKYYKGEEKIVVVEKKDYEESIFSEQYAQALRLFDWMQSRPMDEVPNLIAFCGDRGEGKTSCMATVSHIISNLKDNPALAFINSLGIDGEALKRRKFEILPIIDPAFFDKNHNVLELLLGHLYSNFKAQETNTKDYQNRNEVVKCFQRAKLHLRHLDEEKGREEMYDPLEELEVLSAGVNLHKTIKELFDAYLKYVGKDLLVISIDDLDLNMTEAYRMSEQLRKYLNNDKCILMVSVKVEQLIEAIENAIHKDANYPMSLDTTDMAAKYVTKLIPTSVRVEMPKVYDVCDWKLEIYENRESTDPIEVSRSVKEGVVRLIFNTSRYLFYNSKGSISPIVPNNLRSLFQLLGLLTSMEIYDGNKETLINNKHLFKAYFFKVWPRQLANYELSVVNNIIDREESSDLNKYIVSELMDRIDNEEHSKFVKAIASSSNYRYNISVGDVLMIVSYIERLTFDEDLLRLLFFIKSFYSMRLYEKYDIITEQEGMLYPEENPDGEIYKSDAWFNTTNVLQQLVAGSYFTYQSKDILAPQGRGDKEQYRDYKVINGDALSSLFKKLKAGMPTFGDMGDDDKEDFMTDFKMAEFFALTVLSSIYTREAKWFQTVDRTDVAPYYLTPFNQASGAYIFDVTAPFFNIINVKYTYGRFKEMADIYDFAISQPWSLLRQMMSAAIKKDKEEENIEQDFNEAEHLDYAMMRLLSNAVLRNSEVIGAVMEGMRSRRYTIRSSKVNKTMLGDFYEGTVNSNMQTYRRHEGEYPYFIKFVFLKPIIDFLKAVPAERFDAIYDFSIEKEENSDVTDDMVTRMFPDFFARFGAAKGSTLIKNMQERQPNRFELLTEEQWGGIFELEKKYRKAEAIQALRENFGAFGLRDATEAEDEAAPETAEPAEAAPAITGSAAVIPEAPIPPAEPAEPANAREAAEH